MYFACRVLLIIVASSILGIDSLSQAPQIRPELAKSIERELKGGDAQEFVLGLPADHYINVVVTQQGIDVVVALIGPDGVRRLEVDSPNGKSGPEPIWFVTDTAGDFIVRVSSLESSAPAGRYLLQWNESTPATSDLRNVAIAGNLVIEGVNLGAARKPDSDALALKKFDEAAGLYEKITDNKKAKAGGFARIGRVYRSARRPDLSLSYFDRAIELLLEMGQKRDAMLNLVETQALASDAADSIRRNERVRDLATEIGDRGYQAGSFIQIATAYYDLGDFSTALRNIQSALAIATESKDERRLEGIYNNMGSIYTAQGNYVAAFEAHDRSVALQLKRTGGKLSGDALLNIGNVYMGLDKYDLALDYYGKALEQFEQLNANVGISFAISNMGVVYLQMGDYDRALEYFLRSQPLKAKFLPKDPKTAYNIAAVYKYKGIYDKSLENAQKALELCRSMNDKSHEADSLVMISDLHYLRGDFAKALQSAGEAEAISRQNQYEKQMWKSLESAANANLAMENTGKAREQLESSVAIIEQIRRNSLISDSDAGNFYEGRTDPFTTLIGLLISENQVLGALEMAERIKARSLLDSIRTQRANITKAMSEDARITERRLTSDLAILNANLIRVDDQQEKATMTESLDRKRLEFEDFRTRLYAVNPDLRVQRGEMTPIAAEEIGAVLADSRSAILEFVVAGSKSYAFLGTKKSDGRVDLSAKVISLGRQAISDRVESLRSKLAVGDLDFQKASRELYDLLLKPAAAQLAGKTNIIIVPDGPLWDLPFQALQDANGKYLAERAAISYAPSLTALREMSKKAKSRKPDSGSELLAFGNPIVGAPTKERIQRVFMSEKLEPIPEAERLVKELGKMYGPDRSKVYFGDQAREETAKTESPKYRIVQFATHGILNNVSPMYSHLVLAQNDKNPNEDGLLEAWEMKDLDLKADMVILSACETARGRISNGEGMIGMTWASFIAGAPTTVASQWKVESSSTTELMLEFHRQLLAGKGVSKAEALRRASIKLMKMPQYKHPSYWAGFVLVGDGS